MNTSAILALDTRRAKADGTYPVVLRIIHFGKPSPITTGLSLLEKDWDPKKRVIKPSFQGTESVTRLNNWLLKKKTAATDLITKLDEEERLEGLTVVELKRLIEKRPQTNSFYSYADELIKDLEDANRFGNARAYSGAVQVLKKFNGTKDLTFRELNSAFLKRLEINHLSKEGNGLNGLAAYLRSIRAIYNSAIKAGLATEKQYPFANYQIQTAKTKKRAIPMPFFKKIQEKILPPGHPLFHTRNYFLSSFYLRGMNFSDFAELKVSDIVDGRIKYERNKSGAQYDIKITKPMQEILDIYVVGKEKDDYIFPIIKRTDPKERYKDAMWAINRFNKKLKKLAVLCGISEDITSYVARHTFATNAKNLGIDTASISDMLGHSNISVTQSYLDSLQSDLLDNLHERALE